MEYGSLEYVLSMYRTIGRTVWVSHGSEKGIVAGQRVITWKDFGKMTEISPGKDIVLACDSATINQYVVMNSAVGFSGAVDAELGGLVTSLVLSSAAVTQNLHGIIQSRLVNRIMDILLGRAEPCFLDWYSDSQQIITRAMLTIAFTLTVCITSFDTVWQIIGFVSAAFTDFIVNVILAPLWAGWLVFLQPVIWGAIFAALFTGVTILAGNPFSMSSLSLIKSAILAIAGISTLRELIGTFVTNAVLVLVGAYNNLAGTVATIAWDLVALAMAMKSNAASFILASTYIVLLWDLSGLVVDLFW